jgi:hypothetical protein
VIGVTSGLGFQRSLGLMLVSANLRIRDKSLPHHPGWTGHNVGRSSRWTYSYPADGPCAEHGPICCGISQTQNRALNAATVRKASCTGACQWGSHLRLQNRQTTDSTKCMLHAQRYPHAHEALGTKQGQQVKLESLA